MSYESTTLQITLKDRPTDHVKLSNGAVQRLQISFASTPATLGSPLQQRC